MQIFICGDSTAASYNAEETQMVGWGQVLGEYLPGTGVVNLAMAGRSTKTFLAEGRLQPAEEQGRPGDLLLVQFAHNDENEKKPERYTAPQTEFKENLRFFIRFARERNMVPVLLTPICMRIWQDGELQPTHGEYPGAMRDVAEELDVPLVDLYEDSFRIVKSAGEEGSRDLFIYTAAGGDPDNAHTRRAGAERFAEAAAQGLKALGLV
jgi:lysophospholipase L1-like esterase